MSNASERINTFDISTLDTKRREGMNSAKRSQDVYTYNLYVKEKRRELEEMVIPRGITLKIHPYDVNEDQNREGTLITLIGTSKNPNLLCQREKDEMDAFISQKLHVISDSPYELSQNTEQLKLETKIFSESVAKRAFNIYKMGNSTYGEI